jgi:Tol biopolymer transport system component
MTETRQQRRQAARRGERAAGRGLPRPLWFGLGAAVVLAFALWLWNRDPVSTIVRDGSPNWSPDGTQIVFYSERDGKADLAIVDRSAQNRRTLTTTPADEGGPAFSPDGKLIAFDSDAGGSFDIWVMRTDGTDVRRLTTDPARDVAPVWSPDGRRIAFMSSRDNPEFDVYEMDADGSSVRRLTNESSNWFPQYSADAMHLAFHRMRDVHVMDLGTGTTTRLTTEPMNGMHPTWSPDGKQIAFMSWRNGRTELFRMNPDGSGQELLLSMPEGDAVDPRWSPSGDAIAFVHVPSGGVAAAQDAMQERIVYVMDIKTKALTRLSK